MGGRGKGRGAPPACETHPRQRRYLANPRYHACRAGTVLSLGLASHSGESRQRRQQGQCQRLKRHAALHRVLGLWARTTDGRAHMRRFESLIKAGHSTTLTQYGSCLPYLHNWH